MNYIGTNNDVLRKSGTAANIRFFTQLLQNMINLSTKSCKLLLIATSTQQIGSTRSILFSVIFHNCDKEKSVLPMIPDLLDIL